MVSTNSIAKRDTSSPIQIRRSTKGIVHNKPGIGNKKTAASLTRDDRYLHFFEVGFGQLSVDAGLGLLIG